MADTATRVTYAPATAKARKLCDDHWRKVDEARKAQWAYATAQGAVGLRNDHGGHIQTLFFPDGKPVPDGWAPIPLTWKRQPVGKDQIECRPAPRGAAGVARLKEIQQDVPRVPPASALTTAFGWKADGEVFSDGTIKFATATRLTKPKAATFLTYPRHKGDRWTVPRDLREVRQSEVMKAIEDHNACVARLRKRKAATPEPPQ